MDILNLDGCCGVKELAGISDWSHPKYVIQAILNSDRWDENDGPFAAHLLFTCIEDYGERLAQYITEHKLGTVVQSKTAVNPNSGNYLTAWLWTVDWAALRTHKI